MKVTVEITRKGALKTILLILLVALPVGLSQTISTAWEVLVINPTKEASGWFTVVYVPQRFLLFPLTQMTVDWIEYLINDKVTIQTTLDIYGKYRDPLILTIIYELTDENEVTATGTRTVELTYNNLSKVEIPIKIPILPTISKVPSLFEDKKYLLNLQLTYRDPDLGWDVKQEATTTITINSLYPLLKLTIIILAILSIVIVIVKIHSFMHTHKIKIQDEEGTVTVQRRQR